MFRFGYFPLPELERQTANLANPSDVVFAEIGTYGVAEAAALEAAILQTGGRATKPVYRKTKNKRLQLWHW
jgi:cobalt-precorrin 5A hydrolase/precorrin-3B C17-methyltransferase